MSYKGNATSEQLRDYVSRMADRIVDTVMREAESSGRHTAGTWIHEGDMHHVSRILGHATKYANGDRSEDHLEHIVTRAVMAVWSVKHDVIGNFGNEGKGS